MSGFESSVSANVSQNTKTSETVSGPSVIPGFQMNNVVEEGPTVKNDITSRFESIKAETTLDNDGEDPDTEVDYDLDDDYAESDTEVLSESEVLVESDDQDEDKSDNVDGDIELYDSADDIEISVNENISGGDIT